MKPADTKQMCRSICVYIYYAVKTNLFTTRTKNVVDLQRNETKKYIVFSYYSVFSSNNYSIKEGGKESLSEGNMVAN